MFVILYSLFQLYYSARKLLFNLASSDFNNSHSMTSSMDPDSENMVFDTVYYDNGDYYEGYTVNRLPHGEGTMFYADNVVLTCKWIYGSPVKGNRDEKIPSGNESVIQRIDVGGNTFYLGYGYSNDLISQAFSINPYIQGIRFYRNNCVLFVVDKSVYKDGSNWEIDFDGEPIFVYTGRGQKGNQEWGRENSYLKNSTDKRVVLFVRRKPDEYVFHGQVAVKRIEEAIEKDKTGTDRKVFKFILRRI